MSSLAIDHDVQPVMGKKGGYVEGRRRWKEFFAERLKTYHEKRNEPQERGASRLSPWLHYGHISVHAILHDIFTHHRWDVSMVNAPNDGRRQGWWGLPEPVEAFLDQIITWRDIGFIHCAMVENHAEYDSLPEWAKTTLAEHEGDDRPYLYTFEELETANTHDPLWNAAQHQLRQEGIIHNYLRMLWGKKILEWSPDPQTAMDWMIALNDRWALDGRDPNSYTGIGWVMGKFDRGWTERAVYGKVRCMTSASTARNSRPKATWKNTRRPMTPPRFWAPGHRFIQRTNEDLSCQPMPTSQRTMHRWSRFGLGTTARVRFDASCPNGKASALSRQAVWLTMPPPGFARVPRATSPHVGGPPLWRDSR